MAVKIMKAGRRAACNVTAVNTGGGAVVSIKSEGTAHDVVLYLTADEVRSLIGSLEASGGNVDAAALLAAL